MNEKIQDMTLEVLISIRDEIRELRSDTNRRFEAMEKRLEAVETGLSEVRELLKRFVYHFERDHLLLADDVEGLKKRVRVCEERLGIT